MTAAATAPDRARDEVIKTALSSAPPLTSAQADRIAAILRRSGGEER